MGGDDRKKGTCCDPRRCSERVQVDELDGSCNLAAGLLFRNPIVPAAVILIWEAANPVLPTLLKKMSVIYYLKSLCPVEIPLDPGLPPLFALLVSNSDPVSAYVAVLGLLGLSVLVLIAAGRRVRRLEINYTTD